MYRVFLDLFLLLVCIPEFIAGQQIASGLNGDGCIELFYINTNNDLCHCMQQESGENWSGEEIVSGSVKSAFLKRDPDGLLELFYISTSNDLYHSKQLAASYNWPSGSLLRDSVRTICLTADNSGYLQLFSILEDNSVKYRKQINSSGTWSAEDFFLPYAELIAAGCNADGRIEVFYTIADNLFMHKWQLSEGGDWADVDVFSDPAKFITVARNADGRLEVFFITTDNQLHHKWQTAPSSGWDDDAIFYNNARFVSTGYNDDDRIELLFTNSENILMHNWQIAPSSTWGNTEQFGWYTIDVNAIQNQDQRLEVFYLGTDGLLYHRWQLQPGMFWSSEYPLVTKTDPLFSFGEYNDQPSFSHDPDWHINDHCFIKSDGGTWHIYGIMYPDPDSGDPSYVNYFGHASAAGMLQISWAEEAPPFYETFEAGDVLWAPHIIYHDELYYMFYCGGGDLNSYKICLRTSEDLVTWSARQILFQDGFQARDPMVIYIDEIDKWAMYYCVTEYPSGGNYTVACRTSSDLINWNDKQIVYRDLHTGTDYGPTESPFIIQRGEHYYLFIGPRPYDYPSGSVPNWEHPGYVGTDVFRSNSWNNWKNADFVGWIDAHAPEIVRDDDGSWYISHCGVKQGGLYIRQMYWHDGLSSSEQNYFPSTIPILYNKPNPFKEGTDIVFQLPIVSYVQIEIIDPTGRLVRRLTDENRGAGKHYVYWDGKDNSGVSVVNGIYYGIVKIDGKPFTTKMLLAQ